MPKMRISESQFRGIKKDLNMAVQREKILETEIKRLKELCLRQYKMRLQAMGVECCSITFSAELFAKENNLIYER